MPQEADLWKNLWDRYGEKRPRKLLALDGGGIRGLVSLGILEAIERMVGKPLGDYFDYIAGTSTGAIVAAGLARGKSVAEMRQFYRDYGAGDVREALCSGAPEKPVYERSAEDATAAGVRARYNSRAAVFENAAFGGHAQLDDGLGMADQQ